MVLLVIHCGKIFLWRVSKKFNMKTWLSKLSMDTLNFLNLIGFFHLVILDAMNKKLKKVFKARPALAFKVTTNQKWTVWRQQFQRNLESFSSNSFHAFSNKFLFQNIDRDSVESNYMTPFASWNSIRVSITSLKSSCYLTGRSRGFIQDWSISRHTLRRLARANLLPGLMKDRV